jgi:hypothetical protein
VSPRRFKNFSAGLSRAGSSRMSSTFLAQYTRSRFAPLISLTMPCFSSHHPGVTYTENASGGWDMHTCPVCNGTTKVPCPICKGTGIQTCEICKGKKFIPISWTPTDNPWFNSQPDLIWLKDGQVILGRVAASIGEERTIITRDKKVLNVNASEILPRPDTNSPATPTASPK